MGIAILLACIMAVASLADAWTTQRVLGSGGRELNPVMRWCIETFGVGWLVPKLAPAAVAVWLAWQHPHDLRFAIACGVMAFVYGLVAMHNYRLERDG